MIKNERKEQKGGFLSMLLSTLGASLLGNMQGSMQPNFATTLFNIGLSLSPPPRLGTQNIFTKFAPLKQLFPCFFSKIFNNLF